MTIATPGEHSPGVALSLSIKSVFTPKQQSRGSAHSKAFAAQTHKPVGLYPQKYLMRATGGVYLGFHTLRGRKFPYGNFRTSVFCEVKTQIVGKTIVFRQSQVPSEGMALLFHVKQRHGTNDEIVPRETTYTLANSCFT